MNAKKVIIDCDPGIDDALALMLAAASPEFDLLGITTVSGNVPASMGAKNAVKILAMAGRPDLPVYVGEEQPLVRNYVDARDTHGSDGLGESYFPDVPEISPLPGAVSFLIRTLTENPQVTIIALGPLTNLARVVSLAPHCLSHLDTLISMGGSYKSHGNCSPVAEYNYWCDPDAADMVYQAFAELPELSGKKIQMVGLDVTRKIVLTSNLIEYMKAVRPDTGKIVEAMTRFYFAFHWKQEGVIGCVINDPLAVACLLQPQLLSGFSSYVEVETTGISIGQTVVDAMDFYHKPKNAIVYTRVDEKGFFCLFLERLLQLPKEEILPVLDQILAPSPLFPHETMFGKEGLPS